MASKSLALGSDPEAAVEVVRLLALKGVVIRHAKEGADLGLDTTAGTGRGVAKHRARQNVAEDHHIEIITIAKGKARRLRVAQRMLRATAEAQSEYAAPALGLTSTQLDKARTMQGRAIDGGKRGRCLTTLLAFEPRGPPQTTGPAARVVGRFPLMGASWPLQVGAMAVNRNVTNGSW